jgi:hypothetical protein
MELSEMEMPVGSCRPRRHGRRRVAGMTLMEVLIALFIVALVFGSIIQGYITSGKVTEWSGYSFAAQSMGVQVLEQVRSATWDPTINKCEVTNMPMMGSSLQYSSGSRWTNYSGYVTNILDVPWKGNNYVVVTNFVNFRVVAFASNTNIQLIMARVDTVWPFNDWGNFQARLYTNTVSTYLAPDNPDSSTLGK